MPTDISTIPNEVLLKILNYVMQSNAPVQISMLACLASLGCPDKVQLPSPAASTTELPPYKPRMQSLDEWFTMIQNQSRGLCPVNPMTKYQAEHSKDWVLANGVSRRFRSLATEVFFTAKVFVITPRLLDRLRSHNVFSAEITALMLKSIQNIVVPLPACSAASAWLTLPRYQQFSNLRVLTLWPGTHPGDDWPDLESGKLRQDPMPEVLQTRLKDIGLEKANPGLNMIRCVDRDEWRDQMIAIKARVLPYLRWVGAQRKRNQQNEKGINIRQPEVEAVGDRPEKGV